MLKDKGVLKDKKFYGAAHNWRLEFVALDFVINQKHKNIFLSTFYIMAENKIQAGLKSLSQKHRRIILFILDTKIVE